MEVSGIASPIKSVVLFIVLVLVQVLICDNILLFGVAIPFVYIYFIMGLPLNLSVNILMCLAFLMGFFIDLFCDTMGLNCMACLFLALLKKPVFYAYMPKEDKYISVVPSISSMGWPSYVKFALTLSAIFCLLIFGIEFFSFASIGRILLMAGASTVLTVLTLIATDSLVSAKSIG